MVDATQTLAEEGGFRYSVATEKFADAIVDVLCDSFSREPMSAALGLSARVLEPIVASFMPRVRRNRTSAHSRDSLRTRVLRCDLAPHQLRECPTATIHRVALSHCHAFSSSES